MNGGTPHHTPPMRGDLPVDLASSFTSSEQYCEPYGIVSMQIGTIVRPRTDWKFAYSVISRHITEFLQRKLF